MADGVKKINENIMKDGRILGITKDVPAQNFEGGTLYINPSLGQLKYNNVSSTSAKAWMKFLPKNIFDEKTITRNLLEDYIINDIKIENGAVKTDKLYNYAVTNIKLANNSVSTEKIINLHVTTEKINDLAVTENKIKNLSVSTSKLKDSSVTSDKIAQLSVLNNHVANATLKNEKLFNKTLTHEKIANGTIIESLIATDAVSETKIKGLSIKSKHIDSNQVKTIHILDRNVTGSKIATATLKDEHFILNNVNADKLLNGSIKESKYEDLSITGRKIQNGAIDFQKLDQTTKNLITESIRVEGADQTATVKGNLKVNGNIVATGNITGAKVFNTVFADIAEGYSVVGEIPKPGEAVCLVPEGGLKVEKLNEHNSHLFLGFVSDNFAACYGCSEEELKDGTKVAVALKGRIPIKIDTKDLIVGCGIGLMARGEFFTIHDYRSSSSICRVLDIIDENTALVLV